MNQKRNPPFLACWFLKEIISREDYDFALGDLEETFRWRAEQSGYRVARFWFWCEVLRSLPRAIGKDLYWRSMMAMSTFKTAVRVIRKHKAFSLINITGLSLGIACCMLILIWVRDELSFDRFHQQKDRIYRVVSSWQKYSWDELEATPAPLGPAIQDAVPEVEYAVRLGTHSRKVFRNGDLAYYEDRGIIADPALFKVFTLPFVSGDLESAFELPEDIVITQSFALKYFGDEDPLGKTMDMDGQPVTVKGVIRDVPANSSYRFDFMSSFEFIDKISGFGTHWSAYNFTTHVLLRPGSEPATVGPKITEVARANGSSQVKEGLTMGLQNILKVHLNPRSYKIPIYNLGDAKIVYGFSAIALFVLLIACINFMNLSTARSSIRAREVAIRKTVGARRHQIIRQFFGESFIYTLIACLFAVAFIIILMPLVNRLSGKEMTVRILDIKTILGFTCIILFTGILAGIYPALFLSRFQPGSIMRGTRSGTGKAVFRRILVVFQFSLSILLILGTMGVSRQLHFLHTRELGFERKNVLIIPIKENVGPQYETVKNELLKDAEIVSVSGQYNELSSTWRSAGNWKWEGYEPEIAEDLDLVIAGVDFDFFETLDMELIEGRSFSKSFAQDVNSESVILNEAAVRAMGIESPVGKWFSFSEDRRGHIIGVVKDAHFQSLYQAIDPRIFYISGMSTATTHGIMLIRIRENRPSEAVAAVRRVWEDMNPGLPFEYRFIDQAYRMLYSTEERVQDVLNAFTVFAVAISCLGLFGLASFMAERRTKEIGIRKVLGAKTYSLILMLSGEFAKWVVLANLIAWPLGFIVLRQLFRVYAYRIDLGFDLFLLSGLVAVSIALFTVSVQSLRAARSNPVESLRYE